MFQRQNCVQAQYVAIFVIWETVQILEKNVITMNTVFPHIRPTGIIISHSLQMRVLLENTIFSLHKSIRNAGIIVMRKYEYDLSEAN